MHRHSAPSLHHHGDGIGHSHVHAHGPVSDLHDGGHLHEGAPTLPLLREGEGRGKTLFFDAFSGAAGDMIIAALLDLGVPMLVIERAVSALPIQDFHLHRGHAHKSAIVAASFEVHLDAPQPLRNYAAIDRMLETSPLDPETKKLARAIFLRLGESEAIVHRMPLPEVHFHEVGAVDAIVDIVGAAAAFTYLGADIVCSPLPMGRGFVRAAHGLLPLPPPAVVHCLRGCPTYGVDLDAELVTPTGAAILATVAKRFARWPTMSPERVGFGAGRAEFIDRPNLLRVVLGRTTASSASDEASHVLLEANVDDMSGELASYILEELLDKGALDAWVQPVTMKKGRPGLVLSALGRAEDADRLSEVLLRESTSIGVRRRSVTRTERPRRILSVTTPYGDVRCKISEGPFGPPHIKPEYEDCAACARAHGVPLREVIRAVLSLVKP